ncbi:MAG: preprotein translocase subunit YajC [Oscillospiraceae bacterium]|jgi:preprotein translocase subunit YajC
MKSSTIKRIISVLVMAVLVCAMATGCMPAASGESAAGGNWTSLIMLVVIMVVFYFMIMRPESKKKKQQEQMRSELSVGDEIITIGGLVGKIVSVSDENIVFETSEDRVRIEVTKWAVSSKK